MTCEIKGIRTVSNLLSKKKNCIKSNCLKWVVEQWLLKALQMIAEYIVLGKHRFVFLFFFFQFLGDLFLLFSIRMLSTNQLIQRNNCGGRHRWNDLVLLRFTTSRRGCAIEFISTWLYACNKAHFSFLVVLFSSWMWSEQLQIYLQRRRDRINEKMKALQELIPRCNKVHLSASMWFWVEFVSFLVEFFYWFSDR